MRSLLALLIVAAGAHAQSLSPSLLNSTGVWPYQSFKSVDFHPPNMTISKSQRTAPGYLFFGEYPIGGSGVAEIAPLIMSDENELVWQGAPGYTSNLNVQTLDNEKVLTYWNGTFLNAGYGYGAVSVLDSTYTEKYHITLTDQNIVSADGSTYPSYCDLHESYVTNKGTILVTAYNVTQADLSSAGGPTDGWILVSNFYEIDIQTNDVLFHWSSLDHLSKIPLNQSNSPLNTTCGNLTAGTAQSCPWDYFHINSIEPFDDGYLISSRPYFSAYALSANGSVDWQLQGANGGDFTLGPGVNFSWQHDIRTFRTSPTSLILNMHNNANSVTDEHSSPTTGLSLHLNLSTRVASLISSLSDPNDPIYSPRQGSYQPLAANRALLGQGSIAVIQEFGSNGSIIYTAEFGNANVSSYRTYKYEWHAQPTTLPDVYAEMEVGTGNSSVAVYMSWNGATDYDAWSISAGNSSSALSHVRTVKRTGFETMACVAQAKYVSVTAMKGKKALSGAAATSVLS